MKLTRRRFLKWLGIGAAVSVVPVVAAATTPHPLESGKISTFNGFAHFPSEKDHGYSFGPDIPMNRVETVFHEARNSRLVWEDEWQKVINKMQRDITEMNPKIKAMLNGPPF